LFPAYPALLAEKTVPVLKSASVLSKSTSGRSGENQGGTRQDRKREIRPMGRPDPIPDMLPRHARSANQRITAANRAEISQDQRGAGLIRDSPIAAIQKNRR
jgi:hypothetical protein